MIDRLLNRLFPPATPEHLPDIFGKPKAKAAAKRPDTLPVLEDEAANRWAFVLPGKSGKQPNLTAQDEAVLLSRGLKNMDLARRAKQIWATGETAKEAAKELGKSESYIEKLFAAFSAAEGKE